MQERFVQRKNKSRAVRDCRFSHSTGCAIPVRAVVVRDSFARLQNFSTTRTFTVYSYENPTRCQTQLIRYFDQEKSYLLPNFLEVMRSISFPLGPCQCVSRQHQHERDNWLNWNQITWTPHSKTTFCFNLLPDRRPVHSVLLCGYHDVTSRVCWCWDCQLFDLVTISPAAFQRRLDTTETRNVAHFCAHARVRVHS